MELWMIALICYIAIGVIAALVGITQSLIESPSKDFADMMVNILVAVLMIVFSAFFWPLLPFLPRKKR